MKDAAIDFGFGPTWEVSGLTVIYFRDEGNLDCDFVDLDEEDHEDEWEGGEYNPRKW